MTREEDNAKELAAAARPVIQERDEIRDKVNALKNQDKPKWKMTTLVEYDIDEDMEF